MNNFLNKLYKTSTLMRNGIFISVSILFLLFIGQIIIPKNNIPELNYQAATLNGINIKYNDQAEVKTFLNSIKKNNGYLCLGTSESTSIKGGNYYTFLNKDIEAAQFSYLAGAGRTCGMYIPLFLNHKHTVKDLNIIYMINPVYWRNDLQDVDKKYWKRYANYKMIMNSDQKMFNSDYFIPVNSYLDELVILEKLVFNIEYQIRNLRKNYYNDLKNYFIKPDYSDIFKSIKAKKIDMSTYSLHEKFNSTKYDTTWNILKTFKNKEWFSPINQTSNYRYVELESFILLCKHLKINITYVVAPINKKFIKQYQPQALSAYEQTQLKIVKLLKNHNVDYVNTSELSNEIGAFNDHQHYSSYGAFLIYKKLKFHLYGK